MSPVKFRCLCRNILLAGGRGNLAGLLASEQGSGHDAREDANDRISFHAEAQLFRHSKAPTSCEG